MTKSEQNRKNEWEKITNSLVITNIANETKKKTERNAWILIKYKLKHANNNKKQLTNILYVIHILCIARQIRFLWFHHHTNAFLIFLFRIVIKITFSMHSHSLHGSVHIHRWDVIFHMKRMSEELPQIAVWHFCFWVLTHTYRKKWEKKKRTDSDD